MSDKKPTSDIINKVLDEHESTFLRLRIAELEEERDQLRAEVEHLRHELWNRIPIKIESPEYNELKVQCEKLTEALEPVSECGNCGGCRDKARQALAEYRKTKGE